MTTEKAIKMIDEYLLEPNNIDKDWIEVLNLCRSAISLENSVDNINLPIEVTIKDIEKKFGRKVKIVGE